MMKRKESKETLEKGFLESGFPEKPVSDSQLHHNDNVFGNTKIQIHSQRNQKNASNINNTSNTLKITDFFNSSKNTRKQPNNNKCQITVSDFLDSNSSLSSESMIKNSINRDTSNDNNANNNNNNETPKRTSKSINIFKDRNNEINAQDQQGFSRKQALLSPTKKSIQCIKYVKYQSDSGEQEFKSLFQEKNDLQKQISENPGQIESSNGSRNIMIELPNEMDGKLFKDTTKEKGMRLDLENNVKYDEKMDKNLDNRSLEDNNNSSSNQKNAESSFSENIFSSECIGENCSQSDSIKQKYDFFNRISSGSSSNFLVKRRLLNSLESSLCGGSNNSNQFGDLIPKYDFARNPRDKSLRTPDHPEYNPTEIYISPEIRSSFSDAKKQYWKYKEYHFDEIVFFQQGDFYNLFGPDADVGVLEFGLYYNKKLDSVGFNRSKVRDWAIKFTHKGYKVAVLEQATTAITDADKEIKRLKKGTEDRLVTNCISPGTISDYSMFDPHGGDYPSRYLLVLVENENTDTLSVSFGLSFIDTSTYEWGISFFEDDQKRSQLETLLLRINPREMLYNPSKLSRATKKVLEANLKNLSYTISKEYPKKYETLEIINKYMENSVKITDNNSGNNIDDHTNIYPYGNYFNTINCRNPRDAITYIFNISSETSDLACISIGLAILYFQKLSRLPYESSESKTISLLADEIVPRAQYYIYDIYSSKDSNVLIMDSITLSNLEIIENGEDGSLRGTLLNCIDFTTTPFGKRLIKKWITHPLRNPIDIENRQKVIVFFVKNSDIRRQMRTDLSKLKDIERLITRVQSKNISLKLFLDFLDSLELLNFSFTSFFGSINSLDTAIPPLLDEIRSSYSDLQPIIDYYSNSFDREQARKNNIVEPKYGLNPTFNSIVDSRENVIERINTSLRQIQIDNNISGLSFYAGKINPWSIVVPHKVLSDWNVPDDWKLLKDTKKGKRYSVPHIEVLENEFLFYENEKNREASETFKSLLSHFSSNHYNQSFNAISLASKVDVLLSLAEYSNNIMSEFDHFCLPKISLDLNLSALKMYHPFLKPVSNNGFVPNDLELGGSNPSILLVTGPNMGGKSTLLRLVCILTIIAQLGCYVTAEKFDLKPVDRIFTRIGARDNIMTGKSTFFVELEETARILNYATVDSLLILDELGRGTSTYDGYAISYSILQYLKSLQARVLFSTHYHKLTQEFGEENQRNSVQQAYMACKEYDGKMIFLYKLVPGPCPSSFGIEVASMANIPLEVLNRAVQMSDLFEILSINISCKAAVKSQNANLKIFCNLLRVLKNYKKNDQTTDILRIWRQLKTFQLIEN